MVAIFWLDEKGRLTVFAAYDRGGYIVGKKRNKVYIMDEKGRLEIYTGIKDPTVSKEQVMLYQVTRDTLRIIDWGPYGTRSKNGTLVIKIFDDPRNLDGILKELEELRKGSFEEYIPIAFKVLKGDYIELEKGKCASLKLGDYMGLVTCNK